MPELPEVETIARALQNGGRSGEPVAGRTVRSAQLLWARTLAHPDAQEFAARLPGQRVLSVSRRAKYLVLTLSRDTLLIHLRMSGDIRVEPCAGPDGQALAVQPHDRLLVDFWDERPEGLRMAFNDARKFGRVWLESDPQAVLGRLGPEPLADDFTAELLYARLHGLKRALKPLLLDQAFIAGLGNIYTDEALHLAGIHPLRSAASVTPAEAQALWGSIRGVLEEGIRRNGASFDWVYRGGEFQNYFHVYQRTGEPCRRCGAPISRIVVGQRGTHYCPGCQPPAD